jgi:hypothetical protein
VSTATDGVALHRRTGAKPPRREVYIAIGVLAIATAFAGIWPKYFGPLFAGTLATPRIIHLHAAVFVGWLVIVVMQAWFAATGRLALHRRVGEYAMYWGLVVIAVGVVTSFVMFGSRVGTGNLREAGIKLFVPLTDLAVFIPFFAAAWVWKRKPELHKRFIVVATTILLIAAVHRIRFLGGPPPPVPRLLAVRLAPIYIAMACDFIRTRTVHWIYLLGIAAVLFLKFGRVQMAQSETWSGMVAWFATFYTG